MNKKNLKIIKESDLAQGSSEWKANRRKGIGSSDIATILEVNPFKTKRELWLEKTGQVNEPDISQSYHVKRGTMLEPLARNLFNEMSGEDYQPASFIHKDYDIFKFSADGFSFDTGKIIEIKSMGEKNHLKVVDTKEVIPYYMPQCQWGMMITEAPMCYFIAYNPSFPNPIEIVDVYPDLELFKIMTEKALEFWDHVVNKTEP